MSQNHHFYSDQIKVLEMSQFHTDARYLEQKLFDPSRPRNGVKTILNVSTLPDYLAYVKEQLSSEQKVQLSQYHLQNLLMEYAIESTNIDLYEDDQKDVRKNILIKPCSNLYKNAKEPLDTIQKLTSALLKYMRRRKDYWNKKSIDISQDQRQRQHHAIDTYHKQLQQIQKIPLRFKTELSSCKLYTHPSQTTQGTQRIIPDHYQYENYANIDEIDQIVDKINAANNGSPVKNINGCTLFPLCLQYVLRDVKIRQKQKKSTSLNNQEVVQQVNKNRKLKSIEEKAPQKHSQILSDQVQQKQNEEGSDQNDSSEESDSDSLSYEFHDENQQGLSRYSSSEMEIFEQCLCYFSLGCRNMPNPYSTPSYLISRAEREQISAKIRNNQEIRALINWLEEFKKVPRSKALIINKEWAFFSNMLLVLKSLKQRIDSRNIRSTISNPIDSANLNKEAQEIMKDFCYRILNESQVNILAEMYLCLYEMKIKNQLQDCLVFENTELENSSSADGQGLAIEQINTPFIYSDLSLVNNQILQYEQMMNHPVNQNLTRYKVTDQAISWEQPFYEFFLKALLIHLHLPTNNRKIAAQITKQVRKWKSKNKRALKMEQQDLIQPTHVKHVKGIYLRNMNRRMENGQCGGSKKGVFLSKQQFIKKDIQCFSMRYFRHGNKDGEKKKNGKLKKKNRRKRNWDGDSEEDNYGIQANENSMEQIQ